VGNGDDGGVRRRKAGRFEARFTAQTAVGPKRRSVNGKTEAEARMKRDQALAEGGTEAGPTFGPDGMTVGAMSGPVRFTGTKPSSDCIFGLRWGA
jgi:hypothetical protein